MIIILSQKTGRQQGGLKSYEPEKKIPSFFNRQERATTTRRTTGARDTDRAPGSSEPSENSNLLCCTNKKYLYWAYFIKGDKSVQSISIRLGVG